MPDTSTPAQDLAALARMTGLLMVHIEPGESTLRDLAALTRALEGERDRFRALGKALAAEWNWGDTLEGTLDKATAHVLAAVASVGAEIVWPTSDSAEVADRAAGDGSAPKSTGVSDDRADWEKLLDGESEPSAREKILAEVAAADAHIGVPQGAAVSGIAEAAHNLANMSVDLSRVPPGREYRENLIGAADLLVLAVERLDGAR